ncbi:Lrp family transcriptional regulator, putative [Babesia ovis]|uniref:Lrp family transcriptional regulator, putative n=1 Tax=Babesia ovis TaxID=5869 RepID=A0A9W5T8G9_BABOV|nr:Lrp family transcriptional regulator, putative [Babesia ovis]
MGPASDCDISWEYIPNSISLLPILIPAGVLICPSKLPKDSLLVTLDPPCLLFCVCCVPVFVAPANAAEIDNCLFVVRLTLPVEVPPTISSSSSVNVSDTRDITSSSSSLDSSDVSEALVRLLDRLEEAPGVTLAVGLGVTFGVVPVFCGVLRLRFVNCSNAVCDGVGVVVSCC